MEFPQILAAVALNDHDRAPAIRSKVETADAHLVSLAFDLEREFERAEKLKQRFNQIAAGQNMLVTRLVIEDKDTTDLLALLGIAEMIAKLIQARARLAARLKPTATGTDA